MFASALLLALVAPLALAQAGVTGVVREDSTGRPIAGAAVLFEAIKRGTVTDREGKYTIADLPPGTRLMLVRHLGHQSAGMVVQLVAGETRNTDVTLERITTKLDPVAVVESPNRGRGNGLDAFEDRRRLGLGKFIDSTMLRDNDDRRFEDVLRRFSTIKIMAPPSCVRDKVGCSKRVAVNDRVMTTACPMQVMLDQSVVYRAYGSDPDWSLTFDLSSLSVASLSGVEIYKSASEVPIEFGGATAGCGVLVLWTRH